MNKNTTSARRRPLANPEARRTATTNEPCSETPIRPLRQGDVVETPGGRGSVVYVRMAPPDYTRVEAVSVLLDGPKRTNLNYVGTIFFADVVTLVAPAPEWL